MMQAPPQLSLYSRKLCPHLFLGREPKHLELSVPLRRANMREAEELEGLRFAIPARLTILSRKTAELDEMRLIYAHAQGSQDRTD